MKWILLNKQKPDEGQYVLTYPTFISNVFKDEPRHVLRYINGTFKYYLGDSIHEPYNSFIESITHWMPLPEPPKDKTIDHCIV